MIFNYFDFVFLVLGFLQSTSVLVAVIIITIGTLRASIKLHDEMLTHILSSTMAFFDTTPLGRIINRFSKDMDEVDLMIPTNIKDVFDFGFSVIGTMFVICYANPYILIVLIPIICLLLLIQSRYLTLSRQLKRMVSVTRSPINSSLTESFRYLLKYNYIHYGMLCDYRKNSLFFYLSLEQNILIPIAFLLVALQPFVHSRHKITLLQTMIKKLRTIKCITILKLFQHLGCFVGKMIDRKIYSNSMMK